jgi:hypothetical protein
MCVYVCVCVYARGGVLQCQVFDNETHIGNHAVTIFLFSDYSHRNYKGQLVYVSRV